MGVDGLGLVTAGANGMARRPAVAKVARTLSLSESGRQRLTSKKGFTLNERGSASGTITGSIYIHLHLVSDTKVTADVPSGLPTGPVTISITTPGGTGNSPTKFTVQ